MLTRYFEDYAVGDTGTTRGRTITEADIVAFAGVSGDFQPLHTDAAYAATQRYGQRIAHGMLVLSVATGLIDIDAPYAEAFLGIDGLRFRAPTFIGDTIHVAHEVTELVDHDERSGRIAFAVTIRKDDGTDVARAHWTFLCAKHPPE